MRIELANRSVPLLFGWNVARDREGCLRPGRVQVQRTGGDERLVIDSVWINEAPCGIPVDGGDADTLRFSEALVTGTFRTRSGIKSHEVRGRPLVKLTGRGEFASDVAKSAEPR